MSLKIGCLNARSLLPSFLELSQIITQNNFDIFMVCETWLSNDIPDDLININSYKIYRRDRGSRGGGLCIFAKVVLNTIRINVKSNAIEQLWINLKYKKESIAVGVVYKPPNQDSNTFLSEFEDELGLISPTVDNIICTGDFNINILNLDNLIVSNLFSILEAFNLKQIIESPTRVTQSVATLIDLIVVGKEEMVIEKGVIDCQISDHQLVFCKIKAFIKKSVPKMCTYRSFRYFNYDLFERDLFNIPFFSIFDQNNIDEKVSFLVTSLIDLFDRHAPYITSKVTKPHAPWLTDTIKLMMSTRDKALARYKKTNNEAHFQYYKNLRNYTSQAIKREKKVYLTSKLNNSTPKQCWKILRSSNIYERKTKSDIPENLKKVNEINNFFVNALPATNPSDDLIQFYKNNVLCSARFEFQQVNEFTVYKIINEISSNAIGCDGINITLIKLCCPHILPYVTHIINFCLTENAFPTMWKRAVVTVLPKKVSPEDYKDLRAISILPAFSKIFEKIIEHQIRPYLLHNNIIPSVQSGFRSGHSCTTALLHIVDDIMGSTDRGQCTVLTLLDFSRAFDTLNYDIFEAILHYFGFSEGAISLLDSYIRNRQQKVCIDNESSNYITLKSGVPQGSILGPLLFTLYSSQLIKCLSHCQIHFYADDAQLYHSFPASDIDNACSNINSDLKNFVEISKDHCLVINPSKSNVIIFGPKNQRNVVNNSIQVSVDNTIVEPTNEVKNLGVIIDNDLRFRSHVNKLIQKAYYALKLIYGNRHCLPQKTKVMLCETLVLSLFHFADSLYGPSLTLLYRTKIQKIQNSCLRLIFGIRKRERISHKLRELGWLSMEYRRLLHSACLYYKIIVNKSPEYLYKKIRFRTDVHNLNIRFKGLLTPPVHHTQLFKRCFRYQICKVFNGIPQEVKDMGFTRFKSKYRSYLYERQCLV